MEKERGGKKGGVKREGRWDAGERKKVKKKEREGRRRKEKEERVGEKEGRKEGIMEEWRG